MLRSVWVNMAYNGLWAFVLLLFMISSTAAKEVHYGRSLLAASGSGSSDDLLDDLEDIIDELLLILAKRLVSPMPAFDVNGNIISIPNTNSTNTGNSTNQANTTRPSDYPDVYSKCASTSNSCINRRPSFTNCASCGAPVRISKGVESGLGWGGVVRIVGSDGDLMCSGWLIEPTLVATAGHCVWDTYRAQWMIDQARVFAYSRYNGGGDTSFYAAQAVKTWTTSTFSNKSLGVDYKFGSGADLGLIKLDRALSGDTYSWKGSNGGATFYKAYGYPGEFEYDGNTIYYWGQNLTVKTGCFDLNTGSRSSMFCSTIGTVGGMSGGPLFATEGNMSYVIGSLSSGSGQTCICRTYHTPVEGPYSIGSLVEAAGCRVSCVKTVCTAKC